MRARALEAASLLHAGACVLLFSWAFGGNALWLRPALSAWASLALPLLVAGLWLTPPAFPGRRRLLWWSLVPLALLNLQVILSTFNPNFRLLVIENSTVLIAGGDKPWLPSSARPALTWHALWLFNALFLTGLQVACLARRRRHLRALIALCSINLGALAAFGSLQKLSGAKGLFFGATPSPNPQFFASFIYRNHWAAFALLAMAGSCALAWDYARRTHSGRSAFWQGPGLLHACAALLAAASLPLSSSRSGTLLLLVLTGLLLLPLFRRGRDNGAPEPQASRIHKLLFSAALLTFAVFSTWLAWPVIEERLADTHQQTRVFMQQEGLGSRLTLYRDTATLALKKPIFGWGMASFPTAFYPHNTQPTNGDRLPVFYADAHNDWLQSFAELGLLGSSLVALLALAPLRLLFSAGRPPRFALRLLVGCAVILLYALVEFPFGNAALVLLWWLFLFTAARYPSAE